MLSQIISLENQNKEAMAKSYATMASLTGTFMGLGMKYLHLVSVFQIRVVRGAFLIFLNQFVIRLKNEYDDLQYIMRIKRSNGCLCYNLPLMEFNQFFFLSGQGYQHQVKLQPFITYIIYGASEKTSIQRIICIFMSLIGLVLIVKPQFNMGENSDEKYYRLMGIFSTFISSIIFSLASIIVKLFGTSYHPLVGPSYFHFFSIVIGSLMMIQMEYVTDLIYEQSSFIPLFIVTFGSFLYQMCQYRAFSLQSSAKLAPFNFTIVIFSLIGDYLMYGVIPDTLSFIGIFVIIISILYSVWN